MISKYRIPVEYTRNNYVVIFASRIGVQYLNFDGGLCFGSNALWQGDDLIVPRVLQLAFTADAVIFYQNRLCPGVQREQAFLSGMNEPVYQNKGFNRGIFGRWVSPPLAVYIYFLFRLVLPDCPRILAEIEPLVGYEINFFPRLTLLGDIGTGFDYVEGVQGWLRPQF